MSGSLRCAWPMSTEASQPWIVNWTGIWVGALAALATALILGLIAIAVGAHEVGPGARIDKWSDVRLGALVFSVMGAFMSFVVGGWIAGKIAGVRRAATTCPRNYGWCSAGDMNMSLRMERRPC